MANALKLAQRIPSSDLRILKNASHQVFTDQEEHATHAVLEHLDRGDAAATL